MGAPDCIFCKIVTGETPCLRVLETPVSLAFLDISPLAPGHTLLIPKQHCENILDVPKDVLESLSAQLPGLAGAVLEATGASGLNVLQNTGRSSGQAVFHLHFHLIPRRQDDGLGFRWNTGAYAEGEADAMRSKIRSELEG
jgi:histidine triad (HIT) family protein